jgi:hypothetical protein
VRATVEPVVQARGGVLDRIRPRDADNVEAFLARPRDDGGLQRAGI